MHKYRLVVVAVSMLSSVAVLAEPPEWLGKERAQLKAHDLNGSGSWTPGGKQRRSLQRWSLRVERDDEGGLHGTVVVNDSPLLSSGVVRGALRGQHLSGTIADTSGNRIAEFRGIISAGGVRGTYTDRTGETGDWIWDGPLPE